MSLKTLLMPVISARLLSRQRLMDQRARAEQQRVRSQSSHQVHYFHQVDDPYSTLVASCLPQLLSRYRVELIPHLVSPPPDSAAPEREKLMAYSRKDAALLASRLGLDFKDPLTQPTTQAVAVTSALLLQAIEAGTFASTAYPISAALWREAVQGPLGTTALAQHMAESDALRQQWGHYLGAMLYYAGEWYWGVDRLHHLERRLQDLGAQHPGTQHPGTTGLLFPPPSDLTQAVPAAGKEPIDFFFSLRSPYSAIVARRVFDLGRLTGTEVRLRYVLPMVMRGLQVPREKRRYISTDAAREAHLRGIPFGRLNDPVGRPTERGLALIPFAQAHAKGQAYVLSFMQGVWAEGIDAGSDRGLRTIVERAGLAWDDARKALQDTAWRAVAEQNRADLFGLGLWGVPSFKVGTVAVWGQDRLWAIQDALLAPHP